MTDKELHKLNRSQLLELLVNLSEENEALRGENRTLRKRLADRTIPLQNAGSIAEAALKISGVFAAAQDAADRYLENVRKLSGNAQQYADGLVEEARRKCAAIEAETARETENKWNSTKELLDRYCETNQALKEQIGSLYKRIEENTEDGQD